MIATCSTLAALLASPNPPATISLKGDCAAIAIKATPSKRVTVNAGGSTVRGLTITGGNIRWRGGRITAAGGAFALSKAGYGLHLNGAARVRFDGVLFTDANRGAVIGPASDVVIADSRFVGVGQDAIIMAQTRRVQIVRNRVAGTLGKPTTCAIGADVVRGLGKRDCLARGGAWTDGFHADAVQMRNGVADALIEGNVIEGSTQGITQMDTTGDAPLERVVIRGNRVGTDGYHRITLTACVDCLITGNTVARAEGSTKKAIILAGQARECGNVVQDARSEPCG